MSISDNIKKLRDIYNLSQSDLAKIAGVSDKAVSTWERGMREPRMGAIQRIANHFGLKKSNLIEENGMTLIASPVSVLKEHSDFYLSEKEKNLIKKYRRLTPEGKATVDAVIDVQYEVVKPRVKNDEVI